MIINYQSDVMMKDLKDGRFENEIAQTINEVKKFLIKEYKAVTGNSVSLTKKSEHYRSNNSEFAHLFNTTF